MRGLLRRRDPARRAHPATDLRTVYFDGRRPEDGAARLHRIREVDEPGPGVTSEQFAAAAYTLAHRAGP